MAIDRVIHETVRGFQTVAFDEHAVRRMGERGVTEDEVLEVLRQPDRTDLRADRGERQRFRKMFEPGRSIDVVFEEDVTQIVVVTVF